MSGIETATSVLQRATSFERLAQAENPRSVALEARAALAELHTERDRDAAELAAARAAHRAANGVVANVRRDDRVAATSLEVDADTTAIARLTRVLQTLNQRGDLATYASTDERLGTLRAQGIRGPSGATLAQANDASEAARLYRAYLPGQYVTEPQAAVLAVSTAGTSADVGATLATFRSLRQRTDMTQATAALLATSADSDAAYARFEGFRQSGLPVGTAALLAQTPAGNARSIYDVIQARGDSYGWASATVAAAAARAGATAERASATYAFFRRGADETTAAVLTAASLSSGKTADQVAAAHAWFSKAGNDSADLVAAAWALSGDPAGRSTMASVHTLRALEDSRPAGDVGAPGRFVFQPG